MGLAEERAAEVKTPTIIVVLKLDVCGNEYGQGPCTASGGQCDFTYSTCEDPANYDRQALERKYSYNDGPLIDDCLPYLKDWKNVPAEIRDKESTTRRQKVTLKFLDDKFHPLAVAEKATSRVETAGTYWKNLQARNRFGIGRKMEVWVGYAGLDESEYELIYRGIITDWKDSALTIETKDLTSALDFEFPPQLSSENKLAANYNGGTVMYWTRISEFPEQGALKFGSDPCEYVTWTGRNLTGGYLTGCTKGAFGSVPRLWAKGETAVVLEIFAAPGSLTTGMLAADAYHRLLWRGKLDMLDVATVDDGLTLSSGIAAGDLSLTLSGDTSNVWPGGGTLRIGDELIRYSALASGVAAVLERGAWGTTAASHSASDPVLIPEADFQFQYLMPGLPLVRVYEKKIAASKAMEELRESAGLRVWQGEDCKVHCKLLSPPWPEADIAEIDNESGILDGTDEYDPGESGRYTRCAVNYAPKTNNPGEKQENYEQVVVEINLDDEGVNAFGAAKQLTLFAPWLTSESAARIIGGRWLIRFSRGDAALDLEVGDKDAGIKLGDFLRVTSREMVEVDGTPRQRVLMEVMKKEEPGRGRHRLLAADTRMDFRFGLLGAGALPDWDYATDEEKELYIWLLAEDDPDATRLF